MAYPTKNDQVLRLLMKNEDDLIVPRRIDHWIYFSAQEHRHNFSLWARSNGFEICEKAEEDEDEKPNTLSLQLFHNAIPNSDSMEAITLLLHRKAEEYEGEYDGWEPVVIPSKNSP